MDELPIVARFEARAVDAINAPSGIGPEAGTWSDKPHRVVYDLALDLQKAAALIREQNSALLSAEAFVADFVGMRDAPGAGDILGQITAALAKAREG